MWVISLSARKLEMCHSALLLCCPIQALRNTTAQLMCLALTYRSHNSIGTNLVLSLRLIAKIIASTVLGKLYSAWLGSRTTLHRDWQCDLYSCPIPCSDLYVRSDFDVHVSCSIHSIWLRERWNLFFHIVFDDTCGSRCTLTFGMDHPLACVYR